MVQRSAWARCRGEVQGSALDRCFSRNETWHGRRRGQRPWSAVLCSIPSGDRRGGTTVSRWCGVARWDPGAAVPFPTAARSDGVEAIAGELLAAVALLLPGETKKQPEFREERGRKKKGEGDEEGEGAQCWPGCAAARRLEEALERARCCLGSSVGEDGAGRGSSTGFAGDGENEGKELSLLAAGAAETPVADTYRRLTAQGSWRCGSPHFGCNGR